MALNLFAEYAYKINDPSLVNGGIYKPANHYMFREHTPKKDLDLMLHLNELTT
jgi:hypothetical protein